jgi:Rab9 effector protein with kelch motifs
VLHRHKLHIVGDGNDVKVLNDAWSLDMSVPVERIRWELLTTHGERPGPREYHTANLVGNIVIVNGGSDSRDCFSDIWILKSRYVHTVALSSPTPLLVDFQEVYRRVNWGTDTLIWTLVETEKEYKRLSHTLTQIGSFLFIMGGHDGLKYSQELLLFDLVRSS